MEVSVFEDGRRGSWRCPARGDARPTGKTPGRPTHLSGWSPVKPSQAQSHSVAPGQTNKGESDCPQKLTKETKGVISVLCFVRLVFKNPVFAARSDSVRVSQTTIPPNSEANAPVGVATSCRHPEFQENLTGLSRHVHSRRDEGESNPVKVSPTKRLTQSADKTRKPSPIAFEHFYGTTAR